MRSIILLFAVLIQFTSKAQQPELIVPVGHSQLIYSADFSPNGQLIASGSADKTVKIWDLKSAREIKTFSINTGYATSVQFSPDGKTLLTSGGDYTVGDLKLWDYVNGEILHDFKGHESYAWKAKFTPDGKKIISVSFDETFKVWNVEDGKQLFSSQVLPGYLRGLDIDPKGRYFAFTADADSMNLSLWSLDDYSLVHSFEIPPLFEARSVGFSVNGKYLIAGGFSGEIIVFDVESKDLIQYTRIHTQEVSQICPSSSEEEYFSSSHDRIIYRWTIGESMPKQTFAGHKDRVYALDHDIVNSRLLSGGSFDKSLKIWDTKTSEVIATFSGKVYPIKDLKISDDGRSLDILAYDRFGGDHYSMALNRLNKFKNHEPLDYNYGDFDKEKAIEFHAKKENAESHKISDNDDYTISQKAEMRKAVSNLTSTLTESEKVYFNNDSSIAYILWQDWSKFVVTRTKITLEPYAFYKQQYFIADSHVYNPLFAIDPMEDKFYIVSSKDFSIYNGEDGKNIFTLENAETFSLAQHIHIPKDKDLVILSGGDWSKGTIHVFNKNNGELLHMIDNIPSAQNVAVSTNKYLITGSQNSAVIFWDFNTYQKLITLYPFADMPDDWAVVHPSGLFDGSPGAIQNLLYYSFGTEIIELKQLKERYYEPGLLQKALGYNEEPIRDVRQLNDIKLYPKAALEIENNILKVNLEERNGGFGEVSLFINGKEVLANIQPGFENLHWQTDLNKFQKYFIPNTKNAIDVLTTNNQNSLTSPKYSIDYFYVPPSGFMVNSRPRLHALVIGTSNYRGENLDLNFADKDAEEIMKALNIGADNLFGSEYIDIHLLNTLQEDQSKLPTKTNIEQTFKAIADRAKPEDVILIYMSGHGITYGNPSQFHYLTMDMESAEITDEEIRNKYTISTEDLTNWIRSCPAQKQILILDACSSGQAVEDLAILSKGISSQQIKALDRMKDRTGLFIVTGSAANKVSYEASQFGQSLLTYSLLSGMNIVSQNNNENLIDVLDWFTYAKENVPELAELIGSYQEPSLSIPNSIESFDIGLIKENEPIPLASVKPVFVRTTLMELDEQYDVLDLAEAIDKNLKNISAKGKSADLIFVDVKSFPSAYSLKGFYTTTSENKVNISVTLRRGDDKLAKIELENLDDDSSSIASEILRSIQPYVN